MDRNLLRAGLLKESFIPKHNIRASGFRLSAFLVDIFEVAGMAILQVLVEVGSISEQSLTPCLKGRARLKATEILASLNGTLSLPEHQLLKMQ